ncbi:MAG: metalloregulator ArsR/SmtB family transcription factor [Aquihabitans sp.]
MTLSSDPEVLPVETCNVRMVDPDRVEAARDCLIDADEAVALADGFKLLGEPNRIRILYALLEAGELCVCDLAAVVGVSETVVSHSMRLLRAAGIVRNRRDGRMVYYRLDDAHVRMLLDLSRQHLAHSDTASTGNGGGS